MAEAERIALLVGVGEYGADPSPHALKSLSSPANNVAALQRVLENPKIGGFSVLPPLINPTAQTLRDEIERLFANRNKADLVLLYFTGHGVKDEASRLYLTTRETQMWESGELRKSTAVEASFVRDVMANSWAQQRVVILDCCFSGAFADGVLAMDDNRVDVQQQLVGKERVAGEGRAVMTAATSTQYALEREGESLSVYTRYLVEGLATGAAAPEGQGIISVVNLHDYVRQKVRVEAPSMKPELYAAKEGDKIQLAWVAIDNELRFRKEVEKRVYQGKISQAGEKILQKRRTDLQLSDDRAQAIIQEVLRPYQKKQEHLQEYQQIFRAEVEAQYPLPDYIRQDLQDLQQELKLEEADVRPIEAAILQALNLSPTPASHSTPAPAPSPSTPPPPPSPTPPPLLTFDLGKAKLEMLLIPAGTFWMGAAEGEAGASEDEYPRHQVTIATSFYMAKYPVTQAQYQAVMNTNPSRFEGNNRPVETVSWWEAIEFCQKLSAKTGREFRLPSEAEWEYACRAGTTTPFYFGETISVEQANYDGNYTYGAGKKGKYREQTTDAGSFAPNAFGLFDMHGNVWEWCADHWHGNYEGAPINGSVWLTNDEKSSRLLRGGSWYYGPVDCRSASRDHYTPETQDVNVGFRVVCV